MKRITIVMLALALGMFAASSAFAQANLGLRSIGFGLGAVDPEDIDMTVSFGFYGDLGTIRPNLHLETYLGYWQQTEDVYGGGEFFVKDFAAVMRTKYMFDITSQTVEPYVAGGLGFHFVNAGMNIPTLDMGGYYSPAYSIDDTEIKLGIEFGGGLMFAVGQTTSIQTEAWYSIVSDVSQLGIRANLIIMLGS